MPPTTAPAMVAVVLPLLFCFWSLLLELVAEAEAEDPVTEPVCDDDADESLPVGAELPFWLL